MGESVAVVAGSLKMEGIAVVCCQAGMGSVVASVSVRGAIAVEGMLGRLAVERSTAVAGRAVGLARSSQAAEGKSHLLAAELHSQT